MKLAIIGATGNVGRKTIDILEKAKFEMKPASQKTKQKFRMKTEHPRDKLQP